MFNVKYYSTVDPDLLMQVTAQLYDTYEYPAREFTKREYLERILGYAMAGSMCVVFEGTEPLGGAIFTEPMQDPHFNGYGRHITNFVVLPHKHSRRAVKYLLKEFIHIAQQDSTWYSTTHRRDMCTVVTQYRKINHG